MNIYIYFSIPEKLEQEIEVGGMRRWLEQKNIAERAPCSSQQETAGSRQADSSNNMMMMGGGNQYPNMQQQHMGMGMQPQMQFHHQAGSRMMNPSSMGSAGGYNNWNSAMGNSSLNSLQANESLFTPSNHGQPNHVSDYSSSMYSHNMSTNSGFNSSFSSFVADGLAPPSSSRRQEGGPTMDMSSFSGGSSSSDRRADS